MSYYAIKNRKSGRLLSILASAAIYDEGHSRIVTGETSFRFTPSLSVGEFLRQPLFMTTNVDLAKLLVMTKVGNEYENYIVLDIPFQCELSDLTVFDLITSEEVPLEPYSEDLQRTLESPQYRDVRE